MKHVNLLCLLVYMCTFTLYFNKPQRRKGFN